MEIILSQPAPLPQYDPSPRRLPAAGTGSEKPGTPQRSPAIGMGSDEPGVLRAETPSTAREGIFLVQASVDGFSRSNCTSPVQECILLQPDVGVDDNDETTSSKKPKLALARSLLGCRLAGNNDRRLQLSKARNSTPEDDGGVFYFPSKKDFTVMSLSVCLVFVSCISVSCPKSRYKRR